MQASAKLFYRNTSSWQLRFTLGWPSSSSSSDCSLFPLTLQVRPWSCHTSHWSCVLAQLSTDPVHDSWLLFDLVGSKILKVTSLFPFRCWWYLVVYLSIEKLAKGLNIRSSATSSHLVPDGTKYKNLGISLLISCIKGIEKNSFLKLRKLYLFLFPSSLKTIEDLSANVLDLQANIMNTWIYPGVHYHSIVWQVFFNVFSLFKLGNTFYCCKIHITFS